jgi:hypothetical protein
MRSIGSNFQKAAASLLISQRWRAAKCVFDSSNGASEFLKYALSSESDQFEVAVGVSVRACYFKHNQALFTKE